jgi:hypothetical protein
MSRILLKRLLSVAAGRQRTGLTGKTKFSFYNFMLLMINIIVVMDPMENTIRNAMTTLVHSLYHANKSKSPIPARNYNDFGCGTSVTILVAQ